MSNYDKIEYPDIKKISDDFYDLFKETTDPEKMMKDLFAVEIANRIDEEMASYYDEEKGKNTTSG